MENKKENNKIKRNIIVIICLSALIFILGIIFGMIISRYNEKVSNNTKELNNNEVYKQYSINSNGNLVGDNLFSLNQETTYFNFNKGQITLLNATSTVTWLTDYIDFDLISDTYTISFSKTMGLNYYLYDNNKSNEIMISGNNGTNTFNLSYNAKYIRILSTELNNEPSTFYVMLNKGSTYQQWEPYGVWYSETNYNNYGTIQYNDGKASAENQYYYFNGKTIEYYVDEAPYQDRYIGGETLIQNTYTNFTINATEQVESFYEDYDATFYYGRITLNYLSSDFYANFIYPTSSIDGYIKIVYDDGTEYTIPSYTLNRSFHIYDGSETNPNKVIKYVYIQFHYDQLLTITINTSLSSVQYNNGYNEGYNRGYTNGNVKGQEVGKEAGYNEGYNQGYDIGYNKGVEEDFTTNGFLTLINGIFAYPINLISNFFNFEFMGINILALVTFLITIGIVVFVIRKFK